MPRLFTAIELPASVSLQLSLLRGGLTGARWIDPENYHITLRFFGDIDRHKAHDLSLALSASGRSAFDLEISRLDVFGNAKPHALIASIKPSQALREIASEHERIAQRLHLRPDSRKFTPHITLARLKGASPRALADYLAARGGYSSLPFTVREFQLLSSKASIGGGPYITEEAYDLEDHEQFAREFAANTFSRPSAF